MSVPAQYEAPSDAVQVFRDGNMWCALVGLDIQSGCAGFGVTPAHALTDLAANLLNESSPWPEVLYG